MLHVFDYITLLPEKGVQICTVFLSVPDINILKSYSETSDAYRHNSKELPDVVR